MLPVFNSDVAWELGTIIRTCLQQKHNRPAVVYIAHANSSQLLFFATSRPGTFPDNMQRAKRKEAVVLTWRLSSLHVLAQIKHLLPYRTVQESLSYMFEVADPSGYTCRGGGFPIRVKNVEGIVGVIVVDGLQRGEDNHGVIVDCIQEYLAPNSPKYLK